MTRTISLPLAFASALKAAVPVAFAMFVMLVTPAAAEDKAGVTAHAFTFAMPFGDPLSLKDFTGKAVLIVNTATECGFSGQLAGLQQLYETYGEKGLVVLGVPSNDFGGQEPRADGEIAQYCEAKYGAEFPLTAKTSVRGKTAHPFYEWAGTTLGAAARPNWNFHKYLIGPDGHITAWFPTPVPPTAQAVTAEIETLLEKISGI
jgi:glutathione peroxidase